jgi:hypothetical protein
VTPYAQDVHAAALRHQGAMQRRRHSGMLAGAAATSMLAAHRQTNSYLVSTMLG